MALRTSTPYIYYTDYADQRIALRRLSDACTQGWDVQLLVVESLTALCQNIADAVQWMGRLLAQSTSLVTIDNRLTWDLTKPVDFVLWNQALLDLEAVVAKKFVKG